MKVPSTATTAASSGHLRKRRGKASALVRAERLGIDARRAGFDWADIHEVMAKVHEELDEIDAALGRGDFDSAAEEIGDLMLAIANAPRFIGHRAEKILNSSCDKFIARFDELKRIAAAHGLKLKSMGPAELESLWQQAKRTLARRTRSIRH
ncbi:MAG TPA: MazG nucleotide pyrophosphohydrolase domain-containing protein [Candidatus Binataceae bacterium]|nr:MazG nucleotide pyrophosphohydrolase domain-containing protein [Candidatus Binataceae bacterium]